MNVIINTTFNGPLKAKLLGTRRDIFFNREEAVVRVLENRGPYHKGETCEFPMYDVFTRIVYSGVNTITYSGRPDRDKVPYLGEIGYGPEYVIGPFGRKVLLRNTPMEVINDH